MPYFFKRALSVVCLCLLLPASMAFAKGKVSKIRPKAVITQQMQEEAQAYGAIFRKRVLEQWHVPPRASRQKFQAVVMVAVAKDGKIKETIVSESSGDRLFDSMLLHALRQVGELPPPPGNKGLTIRAIFEQ